MCVETVTFFFLIKDNITKRWNSRCFDFAHSLRCNSIGVEGTRALGMALKINSTLLSLKWEQCKRLTSGTYAKMLTHLFSFFEFIYLQLSIEPHGRWRGPSSWGGLAQEQQVDAPWVSNPVQLVVFDVVNVHSAAPTKKKKRKKKEEEGRRRRRRRRRREREREGEISAQQCP